MSIRVLLMGVIASVTGQKELVLPAEPGLTLRQVLDRLDERFGPEFGRRVFRAQTPPRPLQMHTRIFVNGTIAEDDTLDRPLPISGEGASEVLIYLMPAATGG
jgi:molybdopterin converting factor small subunit